MDSSCLIRSPDTQKRKTVHFNPYYAIPEECYVTEDGANELDDTLLEEGDLYVNTFTKSCSE